jgi:hypothetical protein
MHIAITILAILRYMLDCNVSPQHNGTVGYSRKPEKDAADAIVCILIRYSRVVVFYVRSNAKQSR